MWKNIQINVQNVETATEKAYLINMPNKSKYKGYSFWHPAKCVRSGNNSYALSLGYTDTFKFILKKYGKGRWNKTQVISEMEISVKDFEEAFECMESCTREPEVDNESYLIVEEPKKIEKEVEIVDELKNEVK